MKGSIFLLSALVVNGALAQTTPKTAPKMGHSAHGPSFDTGLRSRPHLMKGIGSAPFKISTQNPEVQAYFDQANALMHSFWWEEAERSLRWCLKLEPENPMVYWALARTGDGNMTGRYRDFLDQAIKRKGKATARERAFIEAWEAAYAKGVEDSEEVLRVRLQDLVGKYPDDLEAKAQLAWDRPRPGGEYLHDLICQQIWRVNPGHPGAVHSTIHSWDYRDPVKAIDSAEAYAKVAPRIGHALHMPGHIYSKIGMWKEAARSMDSATRTELRYLNDRLALPFETWNFQHNRNYLSFIQEQLGMFQASLRGGLDLLAAPTDPIESNDGAGGFAWQGRSAFVRACLKFEQYDMVLKPGAYPVGKDEMAQLFDAWAKCTAYAMIGNGPEARKRLISMQDLAKKMATMMQQLDQPGRKKVARDPFAASLKACEALTLRAEGKEAEGMKALLQAELIEREDRVAEPIAGDPPDAPWSVARIVADSKLAAGEAREAIEFYERALQYEPNDAFALSGLARAHFAAGNREKATWYAGRLEYVWSGADPGLKWLDSVRALKLNAKPIAVTPRPERPYVPSQLASFGPSNWQPFAAPKLDVRDVNGKSVSLADYRGKNVVLVFYLGDTCVHCVEQLTKIDAKKAEFAKQNTVVLGVSSAAPSANRDSLKLGSTSIKLLSDRNHENARRFASYDDFENLELHSTILIDAEGRVRWKHSGGDPFADIEYLLREIRRW